MSAFDRISELKKKFKNVLVQNKKIKALQHFEQTGKFKHRRFLMLIKFCFQSHFPTQQEMAFLDYLLEEYHINFLDWAHKTKWVKAEISKIHRVSGREFQPFLFDMSKLGSKTVPLNMLIIDSPKARAKRA